MKRIDILKQKLTTEDFILFMRNTFLIVFNCKDCPASAVCEHFKKHSGEKMCKDYQKIADFLEEEV